jgi:hypothetical protein
MVESGYCLIDKAEDDMLELYNKVDKDKKAI